METNEFGEDISWVRDLGQFHGTVAYHQWGPWNSCLTDGAEFLARKAGCFWMFDQIEILIIEHAAHNGICFDNRLVVTTIEVAADYSATLTLDNGNGKTIAQKVIEFTNFPLPKFVVWAQWWKPINDWVHMLPGEY